MRYCSGAAVASYVHAKIQSEVVTLLQCIVTDPANAVISASCNSACNLMPVIANFRDVDVNTTKAGKTTC